MDGWKRQILAYDSWNKEDRSSADSQLNTLQVRAHARNINHFPSPVFKFLIAHRATAANGGPTSKRPFHDRQPQPSLQDKGKLHYLVLNREFGATALRIRHTSAEITLRFCKSMFT